MVSDFSEHTQASYFIHTGVALQGRPSVGAWISYGLGSASRDLPDFVVVHGGQVPRGGVDNFASGFLPARHQGSIFAAAGDPLPNIRRGEPTARLQEYKRAFTRRQDEQLLERTGDEAVEGAIANDELAFAMQAAVPELADLSGEPRAVRELYGVGQDEPRASQFASQCLMARRLVERGVRFIEVTCPTGVRWDQHANLAKEHATNARVVDRPIAGLLTDLKARGLLDQTLVLFAGEFGRTPFAQTGGGRDHNPHGFSIWLAGGGVRGGIAHGATDDYGYKAVENPVHIHDLHATILHLLGLDHTRLTFHFGGRDFRLTDVHGTVVREVVA